MGTNEAAAREALAQLAKSAIEAEQRKIVAWLRGVHAEALARGCGRAGLLTLIAIADGIERGDHRR